MGVDVREDVLPAILAEQMVQPEERQAEQAEPEEGGPRRDLSR